MATSPINRRVGAGVAAGGAAGEPTKLPPMGEGKTFEGFAGKLVKDVRFMNLGIDCTGKVPMTASEVKALLTVAAVKQDPTAFAKELLDGDALWFNIKDQEPQIALIQGLRDLGAEASAIKSLIVPLAGGFLTSPLSQYLLQIANGENPQGPVPTQSPLDAALKKAGITPGATFEIE
jgi:hypothetical protein